MKSYVTFAIFLELVRHKRVTAKYLAEKFEMSTRSIYRYISELESAGIPMSSTPGKNGGIGIDGIFSLDGLTLTREEKHFLKGCINYSFELPALQQNYYQALAQNIYKKLNL